MTMSADAGKIMLGIGGCVLLGHDGKVVMADDYYPLRIASASDSVNWDRYGSATKYLEYYPPLMSDLINPVWASAWNSLNASATFIFRRTISGGGDFSTVNLYAAQSVSKLASFQGAGGASIPWSRVKRCVFTISVVAGVNTAPANVTNAEIWAATNGATEPSTVAANNPWEGTGWTKLFSVPMSGLMSTTIAKTTYTINNNGTEPVLYLARFVPEPAYSMTSYPQQGAGLSTQWQYHFDEDKIRTSSLPKIIYNLATEPPP